MRPANENFSNCQLPIYVDLDDTLVNTDTLYESIVGLIKSRPLLLFVLPFWLLAGKAGFKFKIGQHFNIEAATLPYNNDLLKYLQGEREKGRSIILATASTRSTALRVASHLNIFTAVIASGKDDNLKGNAKLTAIQKHGNNRPFAYAGDTKSDLIIWQESAEVIVAGQTPEIRAEITRRNLVIKNDFSRQRSILSALTKAMRPLQWSKNLLVFITIILAQKFRQPEILALSTTAWVAFCACASGIYLINDLCDLEADRHHKEKKFRPLASGTLPIKYAILSAPLLIITGLLLAVPLSTEFKFILFSYIFTTICYSLFLKRIVLMDVIVLSLLYTIRILAGSAAIGVTTTPWLLGFSLFIFLSLALAKRYSELQSYETLDAKDQIRGRGYRPEDTEQLAIFGSSSGYISVLVLALYINSTASMALYNSPGFLWPICVLLIYWISRIWLLARRGDLHEDPVIFTIRDKTSYIIGLLTATLLFLAVN